MVIDPIAAKWRLKHRAKRTGRLRRHLRCALERGTESVHKGFLANGEGTDSMADTFSDFIARERERLHGEREQVFSAQHELEGKLAAINNELRAIDAYEAAKSGKPAAPARQARGAARGTTRRGSPEGSGRRAGSRREGLLALIRENAAGLTRGEILDRMGLKGNKSGEMSVSNALTALTKVGQVNRRDGKYHVAA
jgi:hypothetical protein